MKCRQRDKIVKAFYGGPRLRWKKCTLNTAMRPYNTPCHLGGYLLPRYVARALLKLR